MAPFTLGSSLHRLPFHRLQPITMDNPCALSFYFILLFPSQHPGGSALAFQLFRRIYQGAFPRF